MQFFSLEYTENYQKNLNTLLFHLNRTGGVFLLSTRTSNQLRESVRRGGVLGAT